MQIDLNNLGKQYNGEWIIKSLSFVFLSGGRYWIAGNNGSGKSSLLKILAAYSSPSKGTITWGKSSNLILREDIFNKVSICAPFTSLFEKHTVEEAVKFHFQFKKCQNNLSHQDIIQLCYLDGNEKKTIQQLSSGMQQRLKLVLAICSVSDILFLDEPCSNLDEKGIAWYQDLLNNMAHERTIIVASNNKIEEHFICTEKLDLNQIKIGL